MCLCDGQIPDNRRGSYLSKVGAHLGAFHLDCPDHGIMRFCDVPARKIVKQKWIHPHEAMPFKMHGARLIEKSADKRMALVEWEEWDLSTPAP